MYIYTYIYIYIYIYIYFLLGAHYRFLRALNATLGYEHDTLEKRNIKLINAYNRLHGWYAPKTSS